MVHFKQYSTHLFSNLNIIRSRPSPVGLWKSKSSCHANKFSGSSLKQVSMQAWKFAALLQPPCVDLVSCMTPWGVMNACKGWFSASMGSCQYPDVESLAANASEPRTLCNTAWICGRRHVFFTIDVLIGKYLTVVQYIAEAFFKTFVGENTHSVRVVDLTRVNVFNYVTYILRDWSFWEEYRQGFERTWCAPNSTCSLKGITRAWSPSL